MPVPSFYPDLSSIMVADSFPEELQFIEQGLQNILDKVYYKNLQFAKSADGSCSYYNLSLVTNEVLKIPIPGTDFAIVFNPGSSNETVIPVTLSYQLPILAIIENFNIPQFSNLPSEIKQLIFAMVGTEESTLIEEAIGIFEQNRNPAAIQEFIDKVNQYYSLSGPDMITMPATDDFSGMSEDLALSIIHHSSIPDDVNTVINNIYLDAPDIALYAENLDLLFRKITGLSAQHFLKEIILPRIEASLQLSVGLTFPRNVLTPLNAPLETGGEPLPAPQQAMLVFQVGTLLYSTNDGISFEKELVASLSHPCQIGKTKLGISFTGAKIDLSRKKNIPEAEIDGRVDNFIGIYVAEAAISFPQFWNHDSANSSAVIKGRNLLIGTGGISGLITLESATPDSKALFRLGNAANDHFELGFTQFLIEFKQNSIVQSDIRGYMKIPGFKDVNGNDAQIDIWAHIGNNGDFFVTASEADGVVWRVAGAFDLIIKSMSVGRENNRWYIEASGAILITANISGLAGDFLKQPIDIKKVRIWQDGSIEFSGGGITLPTQMHLKLGPVALALDHISFGSHEGVYKNVNRQYFYFGFNGALNLGPGGVEVRGDGVEFHFTRDGLEFHSYLRIAGIGIDIKIPGNASEESADILIKGYLAMRNGPDQQGTAQPTGPEYQGAVSLNIRPLRISAKATMLMRPKVPAWIVDVELDLATPLPLGPTGLGIYGFRGLVGSHYVASKSYIGLSETDSWFEYLKKKVPPRNKQGIGIEKFDPNRNGFSLGVGASIATMGDDGWAFSSKVFVMISMPEMLLVEGQANALHKRLGIESENDPPFYAFLVIDKNSVQAGIGVNYYLPDSGKILSLRGEMQLGFFFSNSSAWYINIGKDLPEDKRVQARLFTLFNAYAYLMLSSKGIRAGAGARFELQKRFGPVRLGLYAFIDTKGVISFKPIQIGGAIALGGGVYLRVGRFGIELHVSAGLSAEAPKPFIISGFIKIKLKILFVKIRIRLEFTWIFLRDLNTDEIRLIDPADFQSLPAGTAQYPFKAINMLSGEAFTLKYCGTGLPANPENDNSWNNHVIPMDCFVDIEFKRPVKPYYERYGGGMNPLPQFTEMVSPQKARMPQVKHALSVEKVEIMIWNKVSQTWQSYDMWDALTLAFQQVGLTANTATFNYGYWQYNNVPGRYTSLRLLSQSPFSVSNGVPPENFGLHASSILCQGEYIDKTCQYWTTVPLFRKYPADTILHDRKLLLRFPFREGRIGTFPNIFGITPSLKVNSGNEVEIFFNEPMTEVNLRLSCLSGAEIRYHTKKITEDDTLSGLPGFEYHEVHQAGYDWRDLMQDVYYENSLEPISKVIIKAGKCNENVNELLAEYWHVLLDMWSHAGNLEPWQIAQIELWIKDFDGGGPDMHAVNMICKVAHDLLINNPNLNNAEQEKCFGWNFHCAHRVGMEVWVELCHDFAQIVESPQNYPILYPLAFEWQELYCQGDPGAASFDICSLYVHEVCWVNTIDWEQNQLLHTINQSVINTGLNTLAQAINESLPPIWRPDAYYGIIIRTKDNMTVPGTNTAASYEQKFAIGFKTTSPLGFYHQDRPEYMQLASTNRADQYKLAGLLHYIDYQRSYPNADSKLINAKPLYYKNPKLGLFFTKPYVYEFFTRWAAVEGNPAREYQLQSVIRDPVDKPGDPPVVPPAIIGWQVRMGAQAIPVDSLEVETISNILQFGNTQCIAGVTTVILPATVNAEIQRADVKPQKLYTAIFKAIEVISAGNKESIVHTYNFETSCYGDFAEHIGSYVRQGIHPDTGLPVSINAFFPLLIDKSVADINAITTKLPQILSGNLPVGDALIANFASIYDRIISGLLQLTALQAPTGTEVNVVKIKNTSNGVVTTLGLLVRSPEPFNDPKLPTVEMGRTLLVTDTANVNAQFTHVFSVDNASIFITNAALSLPLSTLNLAFSFLKYNGVAYEPAATVNVPVNLHSI